MQTEDVKYVYAAYKMGALREQDDLFKEDYTPPEFKQVFTWWSHSNFGTFVMTGDLRPEVLNVGAWIVSGGDNNRPFGLILGWVRGRVVQVGEMVWFPWATKRNVFEGAVAFFQAMRKADLTVLDFAQEKDKKFFETICRHGIMRRVGHLHSVYPGGVACLYETKDWVDAN